MNRFPIDDSARFRMKLGFPIFLFFLLFNCFSILGQEGEATVTGLISDKSGKPISGANVTFTHEGDFQGVVSSESGQYSIVVPKGARVELTYSYIGYEDELQRLTTYADRILNITLVVDENLLEGVEIKADRANAAAVYKIDPTVASNVPTSTNPIISLVKSLPGVTSNNNLSSQYSVRGGNFDENLIYVNGFEIYRPFLIRSGQQEGLNFINADMVSSVSFSPGGFEAKYGDKLSSVLDVTYKKPTEFAGSAAISLLGGSLHLEGTSKNRNLTYVMGYRQKSNTYLLNSLPTQGQYFPLFQDFQAFLTYDLSTNWQIQTISNISASRFLFIPVGANVRFGTFNEALNLRIAYDGQEKDSYTTFMNGLGLSYTSDDKKSNVKFLASQFSTREREAFDIIGEYWIGEVQNNLGENDFGEVTRERGIGTYHDFARNELKADIFNFAVKGLREKTKSEGYIQWGMKFQHEEIVDQLNEWDRRDSAGFSLPYTGESIELFDVLKGEVELNSNRLSAYIQDAWAKDTKKGGRSLLTAGARVNYWDLNNEVFVAPRVQYKFFPKAKVDTVNKTTKQWSYRLATGLYHQPPFYRELRNRDGEINPDLKAQKSWHIVAGADLDFSMWNRPFKFTTELYYKHLWDLVSYDIDNVLIRYSGLNDSRGYAAGADFRLYGEFVPNVDSWFSFSLLKTEEDIENDSYQRYFNAEGDEVLRGFVLESEIADSTLFEPGLIARPTDQRANFSIFFQDYLRNNENVQVNLNILFGTPFKFSPPDNPRLRNSFDTGLYFRTDIGFAAQLYKEGKRQLPQYSLLNKLKSVWLSLEVFNLLDFKNTVSYNWVYDYSNRVYAVNNRLTSRRLNLRLVVKF